MRDQRIATYHLHKSQPEKLQFEIYDLRSYRCKNGEKAASAHSHSYYQMIWFFNAGGIHTVDFIDYPIEKDTLLFINKDQIHFFDDNLEVEGKLIHFNESFFMHTEVDLFLKYCIFNVTTSPCYIVDLDTNKIMHSYLKSIENETKHKGAFGAEEVIRFSLKSILILLERTHKSRGDVQLQFQNAYQLQFYQFKELLESHYKDGMAVSEYAALLSISAKTLSTISAKVSGKSPAAHITERVVLEAKRLLKFTSLHVSEVAFSLGFEDDSYFIKYFKRHTKVTPLAFRNNLL